MKLDTHFHCALVFVDYVLWSLPFFSQPSRALRSVRLRHTALVAPEQQAVALLPAHSACRYPLGEACRHPTLQPLPFESAQDLLLSVIKCRLSYAHQSAHQLLPLPAAKANICAMFLI
jgi:hypothetical protein